MTFVRLTSITVKVKRYAFAVGECPTGHMEEKRTVTDDGNASLVRAISKDWDHTMLPFEQDPQTATPQPAPVLQSPPTTPSK